MKRLTYKRSLDGFEDVGLRDGITVGDAICRLANYEDTGFEPEHISELLQAENDGRLAVLPCKVGDTVWAIRSYHGHKHPKKGFVEEMYFLPDMTLHIAVKHIARGEFGKAVFLTREEAEAALKGGEINA